MKKLMPLYRIVATESASGPTLNEAFNWLVGQYPPLTRMCVAAVDGDEVYNFFTRDRLCPELSDDIFQSRMSISATLTEIADGEGYRSLSNIGAFCGGTSRLQMLFDRGHRSTFTYAIKSDGHLIAFLLFNSEQEGYFDDKQLENEFLQIANTVAEAMRYYWRRVSILQSGLKVVLNMGHARDPETEEHLERMSAYSVMIARFMVIRGQATNADVEAVRQYARYHDIGKYRIRDDVLFCSERFTPEQRQAMNKHCQFGYDLIVGIEKSMGMGSTGLLDRVKNIILHHHERYDGKGYPHRLKGKQIPIEARIVSVADVFDALLSKRQYKDEWDDERACQFLIDNSGTMFDPDCVTALLAQKEEIAKIRKRWVDADLEPELKTVNG